MGGQRHCGVEAGDIQGVVRVRRSNRVKIYEDGGSPPLSHCVDYSQRQEAVGVGLALVDDVFRCPPMAPGRPGD